MLVVVLANLAAGVGMLRELGFGGFLLATLISLISWYVWAFIAYFVGTRFLPGPNTQADVGQLSGRVRELSMYTVASIPEGVVAYGSRVVVEDVERNLDAGMTPRDAARRTM